MSALSRIVHRARASSDRVLRARRERRAIALVRRLGAPGSFEAWQSAGYHVLPVHFYSPVPDTSSLPGDLWGEHSELPGLDMRDGAQAKLLREVATNFGEEFAAFPRERGAPDTFFLNNDYFESVDAEMYYSILRKLTPRRVVEIGSGWSTLVARDAMSANGSGEILAIEPYPSDALLAAAAADERITLEQAPVQSVPLDTFTSLARGDVLFIDSSHVGKIGSDVLYEILEILPRLRKGVAVHVHDIFLPAEYPREWVMERHRFWNEQYLLRAFLAMNDGYEILWASSYMHLKHPALLKASIPSYDPARVHPGSFWIRRV